jgi:hypothetical protein
MQFLNSNANQTSLSLTLHIVGIFQPTDPSESFWHGTSFNSQVVSQQGSLYPSLVSNSSYMAVLDAASAQIDNGNPQNGTTFETPTDLYWYYNFDLAHLDSNNLDTLDNGLNNVLVSISNQPVIDPFVSKTTSSGPNNLIDGYNNRIAVARIPFWRT